MSRCLLFVFTMGLSVSAFAGEVESSKLIRLITYMKTTDVGLLLSPTPANALTPATVQCPPPGDCVLGIQFAAQFSGLTPPDPNVAGVIVSVDGSTGAVLPNGVLGLDSHSTGGGSNARSFLWMTKELSPGPHTVQVQLFVTSGSAGSADRTLQIDVYKPLP
jgi:hypothetical protein